MPSPKRSPKPSTPSRKMKTPLKIQDDLSETVKLNDTPILESPMKAAKEILGPNPVKEIPYLRIIVVFLIIAAFIIVLVLGWIELEVSEAFFYVNGTGATFVLSLWYFLLSIVFVYGGLIFIVLTLKKISLWMFLVIVTFLGLSITYFLALYFFVPEVISDSTTVIFVPALLNIIFAALMFIFVYNNSRYPWISYGFIALFIANFALGLTLKLH
jgi:hypothetical protein